MLVSAGFDLCSDGRFIIVVKQDTLKAITTVEKHVYRRFFI